MKTYKGSCLCGFIKFVLSGNPSNPHLCYCHMCQSWSGAPIVGWVNFPLSSLTYKSGKPSLYRSSKNTQRGFCPHCGSSLFAIDDNSNKICMTISVLTDKEEIIPTSESFKESKSKWITVCLPSYKTS